MEGSAIAPTATVAIFASLRIASAKGTCRTYASVTIKSTCRVRQTKLLIEIIRVCSSDAPYSIDQVIDRDNQGLLV